MYTLFVITHRDGLVMCFFQFMNKASSVDTPLNTLAMLQSKQKKSQTPYILISGGSQSMLA